MNKYIQSHLLALFLILSIPVYCQTAWGTTNIPTNADIFVLFSTSTGSILCGTNGQGIFRTTDEGSNWAQSSMGAGQDSVIYSITEDAANVIYAGTGQGRVIKSTDDGLSWTPEPSATGSVLGNNIRLGAATPGVVELNNKLFLSVENSGLYISADGGSSWTKSSSGLGTSDVRALLVDNNNNLFVGTGAGIYKSADGGTSWSLSGSNLSSLVIYSMFMSKDGSLYTGSILGKGIYKSTDDGTSWTQVNNGIDFLTLIGSVSGLVQSNDGKIYAAVRNHVEVTNDQGGSWTDMSAGLPADNIGAITMDQKGNIFVGAGTSGVYKLSTTTGLEQSSGELPGNFKLYQNYPNPFNPSTKIHFSVPQRNIVSLKIYDSLGREVSSLVQKELPAGNYTVTWNAEKFASGIYFSRITAGDFTSTKKMILMK